MRLDQSILIIPGNVPLERGRFRAEVLSGLRKPQKELPPKYFYDERGARLFELICSTEEYYIPHIETGIMNRYIDEVTELLGPDIFLIEYGSGNCNKVRLLLDNLDEPIGYAPIDISREQLSEVARELALEYPHLEILPVCADYTRNFELPVPNRSCRRRIIFFPGSTISNFDPVSAKRFLENAAQVCGSGGGLLIGVDLKKDPQTLHRAYNDSQGITAAFNLNLLERINRELGADFDPDAFEHYAFYNPRENRIEMHLISLRNQVVHLDHASITFTIGESIWTESSYKFNLGEFDQLAATAGFSVKKVWTDERQWFSVQYLELKMAEFC